MTFWTPAMVAAIQQSETAAAAPASTYQRTLPNGASVSMTGTKQFMALNAAVSETGS